MYYRIAGITMLTSIGPLSPAQMRIVELVARGRPNKQIAVLRISEATVNSHLINVNNRLRMQNRVQLALWYWRRDETIAGLIPQQY